MPRIEFSGVTKSYADGTQAVADLNLVVEDGEFLCLLGPSGCGKSSTIRVLAGLEAVSEGMVLADGHRIDHLPPQARDCAMIFENYALYPHLTAFENIAMPLRARRLPAQDVERRVMEIARMLRIEPLMARRPSRLSGGEKQRVGVARALVREPAMFLMDEPLGHLEAYLRVELRAEIRRLQERLGITTIYVTHDQGEAAPPMVFLPVHRVTADSLAVKGVQIPLPEPLAAALRATDDRNLTLGIRPNDISIVTPAPERLNGEVVLAVVVPSDGRPAAGAIVGLVFESEALHLFDSAARSLLHSRGEDGSG